MNNKLPQNGQVLLFIGSTEQLHEALKSFMITSNTTEPKSTKIITAEPNREIEANITVKQAAEIAGLKPTSLSCYISNFKARKGRLPNWAEQPNSFNNNRAHYIINTNKFLYWRRNLWNGDAS